MIFKLTSSKNYRIGVEIGSHQLRYVVTQYQFKTWILVEGDNIPLSLQNNTAWQELAYRCSQYQLNINVGINLNEALIKTFKLNQNLGERDLICYLYLQAEVLLGLSADNIYLDYEIIKNVVDNFFEVRMIAVRKSFIKSLEEQSSHAGFKISSVEVGALSINKLITNKYLDLSIESMEYYTIVLIDKLYLIYCIYQDGNIVFAKQIDGKFSDQENITNKSAIFLENISAAFLQAQHFYMSQYFNTLPDIILLGGELAQYYLVLIEKISQNKQVRLFFLNPSIFCNVNNNFIENQLSFIKCLSLALCP